MEALWDTGAQASVLSKEWLQHHLPQGKIWLILDLFPDGSLRLTAANNTVIPYLRYVELCVCLDQPRRTKLLVPFLITTSKDNHIILGYNFIAEFITVLKTSTNDVSTVVAKILPNYSQATINAAIELIATPDVTFTRPLRPVKSGRKTRCIPSGTYVITCKIQVNSLRSGPALLEQLYRSFVVRSAGGPAVVDWERQVQQSSCDGDKQYKRKYISSQVNCDCVSGVHI